MNRFRKKSDTRRPQVLEGLFDSSSASPAQSPAPSATNPRFQLASPYPQSVPVGTAQSTSFSGPPALPALATGVEFRTSLIFPDLTRSFQQTGRAANIPEAKIRSRLAQQRLHGAQETITEEEEDLMFAALSSLQGIRRARGNSITNTPTDPSTPSSSSNSGYISGEADLLYPESVGGSLRSAGMSSAGISGTFPDSPGPNRSATSGSIYPFASLSVQPSTPSPKRHSNNLFGSSRTRDVGYLKGSQRSRTSSNTTNNTNASQTSVSTASAQGNARGVAVTFDVLQEASSPSPSPSPSPIEPNSNPSSSTSHSSPYDSNSPTQTQNPGQLSDKEKTPVARPSQLPLPMPTQLTAGRQFTAAQLRRISVALDRAISSIVENEQDADDDDEDEILAPHSTPLGGGYPSRIRPPTAFNDPSNPIEVSDLNAVLMFLENSRQSQIQSGHSREPSSSSPAPAPVSTTPTPGYVPGMNRPISPRDMSQSNSGHDSEDYSTTPRATSPVTSFNRPYGNGGVLVPKRQPAHSTGSSASRPSTAPTRVGMGMGTTSGEWRSQYQQGRDSPAGTSNPNGLERSYSIGQQNDRRFPVAAPLASLGQARDPITSYTHRRRPSSPLAREQFTAEALSGAGEVATVGTSLTGAVAAISRAANGPTTTEGPAQGEAPVSGSETDHGSEIIHGQGLSREKSLTRSMNGAALPDSPIIDEDSFRQYFPIPAVSNWAQDLERQASGQSPSPSVGGLIMPQPQQRMPAPASGTPIIPRSQTPNNIARSSTPIAISIPNRLGAQTPPIARVGTPTYLVQRSPSANGFNVDHLQDLASTQDGPGRRAVSPRPAETLSHTPSTSSTSAYNPMLHSSLGGSSRSSIGSAGSSYHSSDEGRSHLREITNWLFDPESKGSTFVSQSRQRKRQNGRVGQGDDSSYDELNSKDDVSESLGDQEDVLELLTGLTKKDLSSIQQKLVSAAVSRSADEAIRLSQKRRRPSVQSRDLGGSTPKPQTNLQQPEPTVSQQNEAISITINNRVQSPPPEVTPQVEEIVAIPAQAEPPMIVARPLSPVDEPPHDFVNHEEFQVPSAATTPPAQEVQFNLDVEPPVDQSPRAKALAEALFGGEPTQTSPVASSPRLNPSAEELHEEVERKVNAANTALKSPGLTVETGGSPLRRKSTKKIDLQKISGPQLVSASMSVDAIPLASPSTASLTIVNHGQTETTPKGTGLGSRLRRLRGSIRTKTNNAPSGHEREHSTGNVMHEPTSSGPSQVVDYYPQNLQPPQIKSVPAHGSVDVAPDAKGATHSTGFDSPASAGSAGLKGLFTRLRQPKGGSIRRNEANQARPPISMQPSAFLSSPQLSEGPSIGTINGTRFTQVTSPRQPSDNLPAVSTKASDEAALQQLFAAANNLGLDPAALSALLSQRAASQAGTLPASSPAPTDSRPGTSNRRYDDSSLSSWTTAQNSAAPSRQPSTRVRIEAGLRPRPARDGLNPQSAVVRRTIIYPSAVATSASPIPGQARSSAINGNVQRKMSTSSSSNKRRPMSVQSSQYSGKSIHERTPTPPPPKGAAARRMSQDGLPPMPGSILSGRPGTSAGIIHEGSSRQSIDLQEGSPDLSTLEDGRALQVVELENGEIIWSVLDTLRSGGDDYDDDVRSNYFSNRGSYASQLSGTDDTGQYGYRALARSTSRAGNGKAAHEFGGADTKVFYTDAPEIARLIGQISNTAELSHVGLNPGTPSTSRSSEDLPVEDQLERLMHRIAETR